MYSNLERTIFSPPRLLPAQPQAKIANPKTKRPAALVWSNEDYTNPKYVGTIWWIADHLKNPANPIVPLCTAPHHESQLDADFFDAIRHFRRFGLLRQTRRRPNSLWPP